VLGDPADFTGTISANSGKLSSGDGIDLTNINSTAAKVGSVDYDHAANVTAVAITDGQHTDTIKLAGDYTKSTWTLSSDGSGGTMAVDPPPSTAAVQPPPAQSLSVATAELGAHGNDLFVFNANFGRDVVSGFGQAHDSMRVDQTVFQTVTETLTNAAQAGYEASTALGQNHDAGLTNLQKDKSPTDFIVHIFHS
jgi:hypothetical protein